MEVSHEGGININGVGINVVEEERILFVGWKATFSLSNEYGIHTTVNARFWPWL